MKWSLMEAKNHKMFVWVNVNVISVANKLVYVIRIFVMFELSYWQYQVSLFVTGRYYSWQGERQQRYMRYLMEGIFISGIWNFWYTFSFLI